MMLLLLFAGRGTNAQEAEPETAGKQPFVNRIVFVGNDYFSDKQLKRQMNAKASSFLNVFWRPRLNMELIRRDVASLEAYYHANGFLEAEVRLGEIKELDNEAFVDVVIEIVENEATRVEAIHFDAEGVFEEKELRDGLLLEEGVPFNPAMLSTDILTIKRKYFEKGHLTVAVDDSVRSEAKKIWIRYAITPGPVIRIRNVEFIGNVSTKDFVIEKEVAFESGDVFQLSKISETQRNLFETGLFTEVDPILQNVDPEQQTVDISIRLVERKSKYLEAGFGVGNVLGSRIVGEWGDRNLFGTGRQFRVSAEYSFRIFTQQETFFDQFVKYYRYEALFSQRRVFGTKVLLGIEGFIEMDRRIVDIELRRRGAAIGGRRYIRRNTEAILRFSLQRIRRMFTDIAEETSTSNVLRTTINNDTRDFILDARRGVYRGLVLELAGGPFGGDNDFWTVSPTIQRYWSLGRGVVFAARGRFGYADAYGSSKETGVPVEDRFFTGGGNSVRGYDENSLGPRIEGVDDTGQPFSNVVGGNVLLLTNLELRFSFPFLRRFNFSAAGFLDGGNAWEGLSDIALKDFRFHVPESEVRQEDYRYTFGLGIRYNTPLGPIRLDYGYQLKRDELSGTGRFHFGLGQIF
jgi:outer membrane protein insertion porin family